MRVLVGGPVHAFADGAGDEADAIAFDGGRIVAVGRANAVLAMAGPDARVERLEGRAVIPGFVDAHHHLSAAVTYRGAVDCRPGVVRSAAEMMVRMSEAAARLPAGEWVVAYGWDDWTLAEHRPPTRRELDEACPDHPAVALHFSFHQCAANSRALAAAGIGRTTRDPPAGRIGRGRRGEPDGMLYETAISAVEAPAARSLAARDQHAVEAFARRAAAYERELFAAGITRIADPTVPAPLEATYRQLHAAGALRIPIVMMPTSERGYLLPPADRLDGAPTGEGPEALRVGPMKLFADGGDNCAVCLTIGQAARMTLATVARMVRARSLAPLRLARRIHARLGRDLRVHSGILYYETDAAAAAMARRAVERGFGLAIHAMGNEGVARAAHALAAVRAAHRDVPPPRIEHAMYLEPARARALAEQGITLVVQPIFLTLPPVAELTAPRGLATFGFRTMLDAGLRVAASSDAPVTGFAPLDGLRAAVTRRTARGEPLSPEEAVTTREALAMYTREAARACGCLDTTGTLEPGKRADLVVLSGDPLTASERELERLWVVETVLGGETVYEAGRRDGGTKGR